MEAYRIDSSTWHLEDVFVRCFLLEGKDKALLIDSGVSGDEARAVAEELTTLPITLINTHADRDHIAGNCRFPYALMHPAECTNYYNIGGGSGKIVPVEDGEIIDLGERKLEVILIPGHTPGSIALLDRSRGQLFPGDSVQDGDIYLFGPMRDMHAYILSLEKLSARKDSFSMIYPSHGSLPLERGFLASLLEKAELAASGKLHAEPCTLPDGRMAVRLDAGIAGFLVEE